MAVQAQFGGLLLPPPYAVEDYGVLLSAAPTPGGDDGYAYACPQYDYYCAAQSELTCNGVFGGGGSRMPQPVSSRKRSRDDELQSCTSGLPAAAAERAPASSELWRHVGAAAEVDALVRAECGRLRAGLEVARERQRRALVRAAVSGSLARRAREAEAQLEAARRRAAELEERVRLAAAEAQVWCGVARGNEAVAAGLRATLDALLLRSSSAAAAADEGFVESEPDDAQSSCCYVEAPDTAAAAATASSSSNGRWACRACGDGEASVLVLPCRHLCLCKSCERRTDACPVCAGDKNASIHIAPN